VTGLANTAAIYCRISRDATGDGEGVERQEALCRELADRLSLTVAPEHIYVDNDMGASERTDKSKVRTKYAQLLKDARTGEFSHILAYSMSRLTRKMSGLEELITLYEETTPHVVIKTVADGERDFSTESGIMVSRILASIDAGEARRISERQKAAFRQRALKGEPKIQRQRPFGWKKDGKTIEPEEAALIREAVAELIRGESITTIAKRWQDAGVQTAAGGSQWNWVVLKRVLLGWRTAGVRTYKRVELRDANNELVVGAWEPIITLEERDQALAMLKKRSLTKVRQGKYLLTGSVLCAECGGPMYGQLGRVEAETTYTCKNFGNSAITASRLETHVVMAFHNRVLNLVFEAEKRGEGTPVRAERTLKDWEHESRLADISKRISELLAAHKSGELSPEIVFPQVAKLDQERRDLRLQREKFYAAQAAPPRATAFEGWDGIQDFMNAQQSIAWDALENVLRQELVNVVVRKGIKGKRLDNAGLEARVIILWVKESNVPLDAAFWQKLATENPHPIGVINGDFIDPEDS
jgi:site-specific DNA recombinase